MLLDIEGNKKILKTLLLGGFRIVGKVIGCKEMEVRFFIEEEDMLVWYYTEGRVMYGLRIPHAVDEILKLDSGIYDYVWEVVNND